MWLPSSMAGPLGLYVADGDWRKGLFLFARYVARLAPGVEDSTAASQAAEALRLRAADEELDPTPEVLMSSIVLAAGPGASAGICGSGWRLSLLSCSSSRARTWRTCCWRARSRGAASLRSGCRSAPEPGAWRGSTSPRARCWPCWAAPPESSWRTGRWDLMRQFPLPPSAGTHRCATAPVRTRSVAADRRALRHPSRDPRGAGRSRAGAQGLARRRRAETEPHAPGAGRAADRLVACAARRRRAVRAVAAARERHSQRR